MTTTHAQMTLVQTGSAFTLHWFATTTIPARQMLVRMPRVFILRFRDAVSARMR